MKNKFVGTICTATLLIVACASSRNAMAQKEVSLKDVFKNDFVIGTALNARAIDAMCSDGISFKYLPTKFTFIP